MIKPAHTLNTTPVNFVYTGKEKKGKTKEID
jgi:hypothetical protein